MKILRKDRRFTGADGHGPRASRASSGRRGCKCRDVRCLGSCANGETKLLWRGEQAAARPRITKHIAVGLHEDHCCVFS